MFSKIELTKIFESIKIDKKGDKYLDQYNEDNIDDYNYWIETLKDQYNYDNKGYVHNLHNNESVA